MPREQPRTTPVEVTQEEAIVALFWLGRFEAATQEAIRDTMHEADLHTAADFFTVMNTLATKLSQVANPVNVNGPDPRD